MKFNDEVRRCWSFRTGEEVKERRNRFRSKLFSVMRYIDEGKFITEADRDLMQEVYTKCERIVGCGRKTSAGEPRKCDCPLLCEYCLNLRKAEVLQCLLDQLEFSDELYAIKERGSYSFLRGVYDDGLYIQILNNTPRCICDGLNLSKKLEGMDHYDFQDAFNDTLYLTKETQRKLIDWKSERRIKFMRRKAYLGGVMSLYHSPVGIHTCSVCATNLFFFDSLPKEEPVEEQENTQMGSIYTTHRFDREIFRITRERSDETDEVVPSVNLTYFLDQNMKVRFPWLLGMGSEELAYHLSTMSGIKTLQRIGPVFKKIQD